MVLRLGSAVSQHGIGFAVAALLLGCSASATNDSTASGGTGGGGAAATSGGANNGTSTAATVPVDPDAVVGTFSLYLNPAVEDQPAYDSVIAAVYAWAYPSDITETVKSESAECAVYTYGLEFCDPACASGNEVCIGNNTCRAKPALVGVGDVTIEGVGDTTLKLSNVNNNYQNVGAITYPGFNAGDPIQLSATGGYYPAFDITTSGVEPVVLSQSSYVLSSKSDFVLEWTPSSVASSVPIQVLLNVSKHGGSYGYLKCETADTGQLTIPAEQIAALLKLGVSGFPSLLVTRSSTGMAALEAGVITFNVTAIAKPMLDIEGYCSCFDASDCGACGDGTKTECDTTTKLCYAP